jgi:hypothetical protein
VHEVNVQLSSPAARPRVIAYCNRYEIRKIDGGRLVLFGADFDGLPGALHAVFIDDTEVSPGMASGLMEFATKHSADAEPWDNNGWTPSHREAVKATPVSWIKAGKRDNQGELVFLFASTNDIALVGQQGKDASVDAEGILLIRAPFPMVAEILFTLFENRAKARATRRAKKQ